MIELLDDFENRLALNTSELEHLDISAEPGKYKELMLERAHLEPVVDEIRRLKKLSEDREEAYLLADDSDEEISRMAKQELSVLDEEIEKVTNKCRLLIIPPDPLDGKNIIMEIRAGTGGEEAALFAGDLFRMYSRFAERKGWKLEVMNSNVTLLQGFKEIVFSLSGKNVYAALRYEGGTHRVQRIPQTESSGRIHTSAVTVAVLPEAEETDVVIKPEDLRVDVMRAGGHGGQCVNTTDSAVRLTHIPTGLVVIQQDEKSQLKNKNKAMRVLRSRLLNLEEEKKRAERDSQRREMVGTGDRSGRIRTYNFPQNRVTDHRVNLTLYHLDSFMDGDLDEVLDALKIADGNKALLNV